MTATAASASSASSSSNNNSPSPPVVPDDDSVYRNKQLIAHLLRAVCSRRANSNNNNNNSSHHSNHNNGSRHSNNRLSGSGSSRSRSPDESEQQQHQQQQLRQRDSVDGSQQSTSDYLSASSASGLSFSAQSASPAYVSPFALSPVSESSPWSHPAISLAVLKDRRTAELERVLLTLCDEFEQRLHGKFSHFKAQLDTEPATIRESVTQELETLFYDDNVHWGRIIAVFVLAREICDKCLAEERPQLAAAVQLWVAEFMDQNVWEWVLKNEGWYGLIKFYKETNCDRFAGFPLGSAWQPIASLLTLSAVSIGIALATSFFRR